MLPRLQTSREGERGGRGEESVRRRERVANEVWVRMMGDEKREQWPSPGYGEKQGGRERQRRKQMKQCKIQKMQF